MDKVKKSIALLAAVVLCPCHWPLWLGVFAGTSFGLFFAQNATWLYILGGAGFALSLAYLFWKVQTPKEGVPFHQDTPSQSSENQASFPPHK